MGKTTTCANLGIGLAQEGKRVLLVDSDPQGSLSISLGFTEPDKLPFTLATAMSRVVEDQEISPGEGILHHAENVDLIPANIELTGAYHLPLLSSLKDAGLFVSVINPLAMKRYASSSIRKGKTDKMDSVRIANYGIDNWFKLTDYTLPDEIYAQLRLLGRQYAHYITIRVESKLALTDLLDRTMPGIKTLLSGKRSDEPTKDKLCDFVAEYWHFDNITKKSEAQFIRSYCSWAKKKGHHASESKAKAIYALACDGIPTLPSSAASTKMLTLEAVRVLREVNKTLETILTQMQELAITLPEYNTVRAMNGVGDVLAPRLIAEIGDVRRFHSGNALIAFAGIDSPPFQSGSFIFSFICLGWEG